MVSLSSPLAVAPHPLPRPTFHHFPGNIMFFMYGCFSPSGNDHYPRLLFARCPRCSSSATPFRPSRRLCFTAPPPPLVAPTPRVGGPGANTHTTTSLAGLQSTCYRFPPPSSQTQRRSVAWGTPGPSHRPHAICAPHSPAQSRAFSTHLFNIYVFFGRSIRNIFEHIVSAHCFPKVVFLIPWAKS